MSTTDSVLRTIDGLAKARQFTDALANAQAAAKKFPHARDVSMRLAELQYTCKLYDQSLNLFTSLHKIKQDANDKTELPVLLGIANCQIKKSAYAQATTSPSGI